MVNVSSSRFRALNDPNGGQRSEYSSTLRVVSRGLANIHLVFLSEELGSLR